MTQNLLALHLDDLAQNPILQTVGAAVQGRISIQLANANAITLADGSVLIVVDHSGSMSGAKIRRANEAVAKLVDQLPDGTTILVIYFSTNHSIIEFYDGRGVMLNDPDGSVVVDGNSRSHITKEILGIGSASATYFAAPHQYGQKWLLARSGPKYALTCTDGISSDPSTDNPVMQNFAQALGAAGVPWFIAGIGSDYDFQTLTSWAAYADGLARVIHVDDTVGLSSLLDAIAKKIQRSVFADFAVNFLPVADVQVRKIIHLGTPPVEIPVTDKYRVEHPNAGSMDTAVGIPYIVQFMFEKNPPVGTNVDVARLQVFYTNAAGARVEENLMLQIEVTTDRDRARNMSQTAIETMQKSGVQATFAKAVNMMTKGETMLQTASTQAQRTAAETMIKEAQTMLQGDQKNAHKIDPQLGTAFDSFLSGVGGGDPQDKSKAALYTRTVLGDDPDFADFISGQGGKS